MAKHGAMPNQVKPANAQQTSTTSSSVSEAEQLAALRMQNQKRLEALKARTQNSAAVLGERKQIIQEFSDKGALLFGEQGAVTNRKRDNVPQGNLHASGCMQLTTANRPTSKK